MNPLHYADKYIGKRPRQSHENSNNSILMYILRMCALDKKNRAQKMKLPYVFRLKFGKISFIDFELSLTLFQLLHGSEIRD